MGPKLEIAKSGRAACRICGEKIAKGEHRLGVEYDSEYGTSYRWHHLMCAAWRLAAELAEALGDRDGEIPNEAELRSVMAGRRTDESNTSSDAGIDYPPYPSASLAPSARSRCAECGEFIAKGDVRAEIEHEVELNGRRRTVTGYLHPACAPHWARDNWQEEVSFVDTLRHNATVDVPAEAFAELATAPVLERPSFEGVEEKAIQSIAKKIRRASDTNGFEQRDALDEVDYGQRDSMLWYLARHQLCDAHKDPGMWTLLAKTDEGFDLDVTLALLCQVPALLEPVYGSDWTEYTLPNWSTELEALAARALRTDAARVRARLDDMRANVRRGVCLVLAMRGEEVPEAERTPIAQGLATQAARDYALDVLDVTTDVNPDQRRFDPAPIARRLDAEAWRTTLMKETSRHRWREVELVWDALVAMKPPMFIKSLVKASGGDVSAETFVQLLEARKDPPVAVVERLMALAKDDRSSSRFERLLTTAIARCPGEVPAGAEDLLNFLAMNPNRSNDLGAVERYRRALTALGDERIDALARRLVTSRFSSRAAAPLSVRFDAEVYARIFEAPNTLLSESLLALPGHPTLPVLEKVLDAGGSEDRLRRITGAITLVLRDLAAAGETIDGTFLPRLGLDSLDEVSSQTMDVLGTILPAVEPEPLVAFVRAHLADVEHPESRLWVAAHAPDPSLRGEAMAALIDRRASIQSIDVLRRALAVLGDEAMPLLRAHIGRSDGDRTFLARLESVLPKEEVAQLTQAQGLSEETLRETMLRLAEAGKTRERIYVFDADEELAPPRPESLTCYGGHAPAGVEVPTDDDEPLTHVLTLDLHEAPEMGVSVPGKRTLSLFLRSPGTGKYNDQGVLVTTAEPGARAEDSTPFALVPFDVPTSVFSRRARNPQIKQLRTLLFNRDGYALGEPMWIQSADPQGKFLFQMSERFGVNLGDSGEMYVWQWSTSWQCY